MFVFIKIWYQHPCLEPFFDFSHGEFGILAFFISLTSITLFYLHKNILDYFIKHKYMLVFVFIFIILVMMKVLTICINYTYCPEIEMIYSQKTYSTTEGFIKNYNTKRQSKNLRSKHFSVNNIQFDVDGSADFYNLNTDDKVRIKYYGSTILEVEYFSK